MLFRWLLYRWWCIDSIPVREAYRRGARDITVILSTLVQNETAEISVDAEKAAKEIPNIAESMAVRAENYNDVLEFIRNPPKKMRPSR